MSFITDWTRRTFATTVSDTPFSIQSLDYTTTHGGTLWTSQKGFFRTVTHHGDIALTGRIIGSAGLSIGLRNLSRSGNKIEGNHRTSTTGRKRFVQTSFPDRKILYGSVEFSPTIIYAGNSGEGRMVVICVITDHNIENLTSLKFDDQEFLTEAELTTLNTTGEINISDSGGQSDLYQPVRNDRIQTLNSYFGIQEGRPPIRSGFIQHHSGNTNNINICSFIFSKTEGGLMTKLDGNNLFKAPTGFVNWSATNMKMKGVSWIAIQIAGAFSRQYSPIFGSLPNITIRTSRNRSTLNGQNLFNAKYSADNPALCAYDYISRYTSYKDGSMGEQVIKKIDIDSFKTAAENCHIRDYTANGLVSLTETPINVINEFNTAMGSGNMSDINGIIHCYAGVSGTPDKRINDDDIEVDSWSLTPTPDIVTRQGQSIVEYGDTEGKSQYSSVYLEGAQNFSKLQQSSSMITNQRVARLVAKINLDRSWDTNVVTFTLNNFEKLPEPNELIYLDITKIGLRHLFRVNSITLNNSGTASIECISETASLYDFIDTDTYRPPTNPDSRFSEGYVIINTEGDKIIISQNDDNTNNFLIK